MYARQLRGHGDHVDGAVKAFLFHDQTPRWARGDSGEGRGQRLDRLSLLLGQRPRDRDDDGSARRSPLPALPAEAEGLPCRRARRDPDGHRFGVERRHLHIGTERRFGEGDGHIDHQVLAEQAEERMIGDLDAHVEVAGWTTESAGATASLEADLLAGLHAGGDAHLHIARPNLDADARGRSCTDR